MGRTRRTFTKCITKSHQGESVKARESPEEGSHPKERASNANVGVDDIFQIINGVALLIQVGSATNF